MRNPKSISHHNILDNLNDERGILTVEFIFGIFITFGLLTLLLRVTYTFAVVEITQYIAFSTSRTYAAAHTSEQAQRQPAEDKYSLLTQDHDDFSSLYGRGWFAIPESPVIGHFADNGGPNTVGPSYGEDGAVFGGTLPFIGTRILFQAPVLTANVPFLGRTFEDDEPFSAGIAAFLIREPSQQECQDFMRDRYAGIRNIAGGRFNGLALSDQAYVPMEDNGC